MQIVCGADDREIGRPHPICISILPYQQSLLAEGADAAGRTDACVFFCTTGAAPLTGFMVQAAPFDPAIHYYTPELVSMTGDILNQLIVKSEELSARLYGVNSLELAGCNERVPEFLKRADLSTIRQIDISGVTNFDVDNFLRELFRDNYTLRSLTKINVTDVKLSKETLEILREDTPFKGPLIRDMWKISDRHGVKVANICVVSSPGRTLTVDEKRLLETPSERRVDIVYRSEKYSPGLAAHLQLQFD